MRVLKSALGLTMVAAIAGCGGGGNGGVAAVRQTLHTFGNDLLSGNAAGACSLYTASRLQAIGGRSGCKRILAIAVSSPAAKAKLRQEVKRIDSLPISVHGNTATVSGSGGAKTILVYQNGRWLFGASAGSTSSTGTSTAG